MAAARPSVAIIGAGPYGLSAASHLRSAGVETRVFGRPMEFWRHQMPAGMLLRSPWEASRISDPRRILTLEAYEEAHARKLQRHMHLSDFVDYGQWFQRRCLPDVDERKVVLVQPAASGFRLVLEDGESLVSDRVVVATGLAAFPSRPVEFDGLPASLASHSSDHHQLAKFAGQQVVVVGGGQSAVESAVLLHENGAEVEVVSRAPRIRWLRRGAWLRRHLGPFYRVLYPASDVGPPGLNWIVALPGLFRLLPLALQARIAARCIRPAASAWLLPRAGGVQFTLGRRIVSAKPVDDRLGLTLDDGSTRRVDHALLATGYRIDVSGYSFLPAELSRSVRTRGGYPELTGGFESSVPGLYFLGAAAALSFGPVLRFVSGTWYASQALTQALLARSGAGQVSAAALMQAGPAR
jgi:FAD-dependent urate hydroxylase